MKKTIFEVMKFITSLEIKISNKNILNPNHIFGSKQMKKELFLRHFGYRPPLVMEVGSRKIYDITQMAYYQLLCKVRESNMKTSIWDTYEFLCSPLWCTLYLISFEIKFI